MFSTQPGNMRAVASGYINIRPVTTSNGKPQ